VPNNAPESLFSGPVYREYLPTVQNDGSTTLEVAEVLGSKQNNNAILFVPESLKTEAIYVAAVQNNGRILEKVPEPLKTEAVCMAAVRQNSAALEFVPENLRAQIETQL
jgi:hypothetical protein